MNALANARGRPNRISRQYGAFLIEVMIAVIVLSIGILGAAALQLTSKRANFEATQRASAAWLANDMIERMRTNPDQFSTYTLDGAGRTLTGSVMGAVNCAGGCATDQFALLDLYEWEQNLIGAEEQAGGTAAGGLSSPTGCLTGALSPGGGGATYTVAIAWRGLTKLSNPVINTCGQGSGLYDTGTESDVHRRVLVVNTFIAEPF